MPKPSVGRVVHYVSYGTPGGEYTSQCRAATITEVSEEHPKGFPNADEYVGLAAINPTGVFFHPLALGGCRHDEDDKDGGTWHWPERTVGEDLGAIAAGGA